MQQFTLIAHASTPCRFINSVEVQVTRTSASELGFTYLVAGDIARLRIPPPRTPARADELWRETCFEAFLRPGGSTAYSEFNFAPSAAWAVYRFEDYRRGMQPVELMQPPVIHCARSPELLQVEVRLTIALAAEHELHMALASVLQDNDGRVSYWALAHPAGKPDFHDASGFVAQLEP